MSPSVPRWLSRLSCGHLASPGAVGSPLESWQNTSRRKRLCASSSSERSASASARISDQSAGSSGNSRHLDGRGGNAGVNAAQDGRNQH